MKFIMSRLYTTIECQPLCVIIGSSFIKIDYTDGTLTIPRDQVAPLFEILKKEIEIHHD